jgi:hypothetical protein
MCIDFPSFTVTLAFSLFRVRLMISTTEQVACNTAFLVVLYCSWCFLQHGMLLPRRRGLLFFLRYSNEPFNFPHFRAPSALRATKVNRSCALEILQRRWVLSKGAQFRTYHRARFLGLFPCLHIGRYNVILVLVQTA